MLSRIIISIGKGPSLRIESFAMINSRGVIFFILLPLVDKSVKVRLVASFRLQLVEKDLQ